MPYLLLALAAGVILLLLPSGKATPAKQDENGSETYRQALENEVETLLCSMEGVKRCRVVLTLEQGYAYTYATDQRVNEHSGGKETEKTVVLADTSGGEAPLLLSEKQPTVCGAAVVCKGADKATCARILSLLQALFHLESSQISIQT